MRKGFFTILLLFLSLCLYSQNNSPEEQNARSFFELNHPYSSIELDNLSVDTSLIYNNLTIVNFTSPRGFVIIRTSSEANEVMAYSYTDHFSFNVDTTGVIESLADALSVNTEIPGYDPNKLIPKLKTGKLAIEPLCEKN